MGVLVEGDLWALDRERGAEDGCGEEVRWVGVAAGLAEGVAMVNDKR